MKKKIAVIFILLTIVSICFIPKGMNMKVDRVEYSFLPTACSKVYAYFFYTNLFVKEPQFDKDFAKIQNYKEKEEYAEAVARFEEKIKTKINDYQKCIIDGSITFSNSDKTKVDTMIKESSELYYEITKKLAEKNQNTSCNKEKKDFIAKLSEFKTKFNNTKKNIEEDIANLNSSKSKYEEIIKINTLIENLLNGDGQNLSYFTREIYSNSYCNELLRLDQTKYSSLGDKTVLQEINSLLAEIKELQGKVSVECYNKGEIYSYYDKYQRDLSLIILNAKKYDLSKLNSSNEQERVQAQNDLSKLKQQKNRYESEFNKQLALTTNTCYDERISGLKNHIADLEEEYNNIFKNVFLNQEEENNIKKNEVINQNNLLEELKKKYNDYGCEVIVKKELSSSANEGEKMLLKQQKEYCLGLQYQKSQLETEAKKKLDELKKDGVDVSDIEGTLNDIVNDWDKVTGSGEGCTTLGRTLELLKDIYTLMLAFAAVFVIGAGMFDFVKASAGKDNDSLKKAGSTFSKRLIALVVLLILPIILNLIFKIFEIENSTCGIGLF